MPIDDFHAILDRFLAWRLAPLAALSAEDRRQLYQVTQLPAGGQQPSYYQSLHSETLTAFKKALVAMVRALCYHLCFAHLCYQAATNRHMQCLGMLPMHHRLFAGGLKMLEICHPSVHLDIGWQQYCLTVLNEWRLETVPVLTLQELAVIDQQSVQSTDFVAARWSTMRAHARRA